jgi:hypothetical protein
MASVVCEAIASRYVMASVVCEAIALARMSWRAWCAKPSPSSDVGIASAQTTLLAMTVS